MTSPLSLPAGVLWDMDGTLIDSEPYWIPAETELVESFGGTWTHEMALQMVGNSLLTSAGILQAAGVDMELGEIVDWLLDRVVAATVQRVPWQPGALELLKALAAAAELFQQGKAAEVFKSTAYAVAILSACVVFNAALLVISTGLVITVGRGN
jgi:beta-phosphoglucomutase-like phosphatase (HAD superfamily)